MSEFKDGCKQRLQFGLPLSLNQQRELYEQAFDEPIKILKRCNGCGAAGCNVCGQTGYVEK